MRRLNWRTFLNICAGLLLPLPVLLVLGPLLRPEIKPAEPTRKRVSPMLDIEQRARLMTYGRSCSSSAECEPPLDRKSVV